MVNFAKTFIFHKNSSEKEKTHVPHKKILPQLFYDKFGCVTNFFLLLFVLSFFLL